MCQVINTEGKRYGKYQKMIRTSKKLIKNMSKLERDSVNEVAALSINQCINLFAINKILANLLVKDIEESDPEFNKGVEFSLQYLFAGAKFLKKNFHLLENAFSDEELCFIREMIKDVEALVKDLNKERI